MSKQELKLNPARFGKSIHQIQEFIRRVKSGQDTILVGMGYVVCTEEKWNTRPEPECEWVSVEDRLPDKPNKAEYEYVDCWIFYKGQIMRIPWNCEERCWDDADYDDHFCAAKVPTHWMLAPLPAPPETEVKG
jgi:hypothetical protein